MKTERRPTPAAPHPCIHRPDALAHIADLVIELKDMARKADAPFLASLLGMAHLEAVLEADRAAKRELPRLKV